MKKINQLIKKAMLRKKKENPNFSLRFIATKLSVQHSFLSAIFNNKKKWPLQLLDQMVELLDMDELSLNRLAEAIVESQMRDLRTHSKLIQRYTKQKSGKNQVLESSNEISEIPESKMNLHSNWYHITLLDLITCEEFTLNYDWIAQRLGIDVYQAKFAWQFLLDKGYISKKQGRWIKNEEKIRLPTKQSFSTVQNYHHTLITKGLNIMKNQSDTNSFNNRLIAGISVAGNLNQIQIAKDILHESAYEAATQLTEGPCSEVYQIYVMLFPVTKSI